METPNPLPEDRFEDAKAALPEGQSGTIRMNCCGISSPGPEEEQVITVTARIKISSSVRVVTEKAEDGTIRAYPQIFVKIHPEDAEGPYSMRHISDKGQ